MNQSEVKPIVCYTCHEVGHKSPQSPKCTKDNVKRVAIPKDEIVHMAPNEVMSEVAGKKIPLTFDTGAQISLVPTELVCEDEFTGKVSKFKATNSKGEWSENRVAKVTFTVDDKCISKAVALPGISIDWTEVLRVDLADGDMTAKMLKHVRRKTDLPQAEIHYLPPLVKEGSVCGAVLVSEGEVEERVEEEVVLEPETHTKESEAHITHATGEESDVGKKEGILVLGDGSSADVAVNGSMQGRSADIGEEETV